MNQLNRKLAIDSEPIEGFKVMEWLRGVRDEYYKLYKSNPKEYFKSIGIDYEKVKDSLLGAKKLRSA